MERRLGRGLGSLLGAQAPAELATGSLEIPLSQIRPNPHQPRKDFDRAALEELSESIRRHGILQPVIVRSASSGYELVSGERRWRASQIAGRLTIPAIVRTDVSDAEMLELALVENLQRRDLDTMERARGYRQMIEQLQLTQEQVADRVGLNRATVTNHLRLLELPEQAQEALSRGLLSMGHARALLGLADAKQQLQVMSRVAREGLSVRQVEELVRSAQRPRVPQGSAPAASRGAAWVPELEARMRAHLGTKVSIRNGPNYTGQITIEYFGREDLDRLCELLAPRSTL